MSIAITLLWQIIMMFLLVGTGFVLFRSGKISPEGSKTIGNVLIFASLPCIIINGFLVDYSPEKVISLGISALSAALVLTLSILISRIFFAKDGIAGFAASFSNPGFFGVPLILSCIGNDAVFYVASFIAFLNLLQWTYGVFVMTGQKGSLTPGKILKAPFMIAILIGLFFFFTRLPLPEVVRKCLTHLSGLNTPLGMFTIGIYLAQTDVKKMLIKPKLYLISAVRLVLIPLASLAVLLLIPDFGLAESAVASGTAGASVANALGSSAAGTTALSVMQQLKLALFIAAACPVGSNVAVYAQLHNRDYRYAVETVVISTLLSVVTMPVLVRLALMWI